MYSILIVEDEVKIARILHLELSHEGYEVDIAETGKEGLDKALNRPWDLILLDIMLPELNGIEVMRRIKKVDPSIPIILLTARNEIPDKVTGLDQGANDYITKPFEIEEVLARIRACLRVQAKTNGGQHKENITVGSLTVNTKTREVKRNGKKIELTIKEFDLLVYLMENKSIVLTREQIIQNVWGYNFLGDTNIVDVYIRYVRKKVDYGFDIQLIHTVRGIGYGIKENLHEI